MPLKKFPELSPIIDLNRQFLFIKLNVELTPSFKVLNTFSTVIIGAFSLANIVPDLQAFAITVGTGTKILGTIDLVPPIDSASQAGEISDYVEGHIQTSVAIVGASGSGKSM
ncbi:6728_t:CDS:2 [Dentiscutata erythropus]|uniref:6728_t:CDS:1 n=1 Tax=Dentiscutata erythropus TaxID=1348616 RepID=A0A9N9NZG9_9GLOM|nr:6728_t:CDS:2 [Dentiscutata erythropus]